MRDDWQLNPSLELVELGDGDVFARWRDGAVVLAGVEPADLYSRAVLADPDAVAALAAEGILVRQTSAESIVVTATVFGNGTLGRAISASLEDAGIALATSAPADVAVVAVEDVTLAAAAALVEEALDQARACLSVAVEPDGIVIGPMRIAGTSPCVRCSRLSAYPDGEVRAAAGAAFAQLGAFRAERLPRHRWLVATAAAAAVRAIRASAAGRPMLADAVWRIGLDGELAAVPIRRLAGCVACAGSSPDQGRALGFAWDGPPVRAAPAAAAAGAGADDASTWFRCAVLALAGRGAGRHAHLHGSLQDHLVATFRVLRAWGMPEAVCRAGLFHSVYGSDAFDVALFGAGERDEVRDLIGPEAEELAFAFGTIDRRRYRGEFEPLVVHNWRTGETATIDRDAAESLLAIELANRAEQASAEDGGPGLWLAEAALRTRFLRGGCHAIAVFQAARPPASTELEAEARAAYLRACGAELADAEVASELEHAIAANPLVGEPRLLLAEHLARAGDPRARGHAIEALRLLALWGISWDRRRTHGEWTRRAAALLAPEPPP